MATAAKNAGRRAWLWAICLLFAGGCPKSAPQPVAVLPFTGVKTTLLVVDDTQVESALTPLKSEWKAATGGELIVRGMPREQFLAVRTLAELQADAVIYPPRLLGHLAERDWLLPLSAEFLGEQELAWQNIFELLQVRCSHWGSQAVAVPLGSPVFTLMYRADIFAKLGKAPPTTWDEYHELVTALAKQLPPDADGLPKETDAASETPVMATVEPLAPAWAAKLLLARAAAYGRHRDNYSTLFRMDTMEPLIAGEPFVLALTELATAAKAGRFSHIKFSPEEVQNAVLRGEAIMGLTWTSAVKSASTDQASADSEPASVAAVDRLPPGAKIAFAEMPGAMRSYNVATNTWEVRGADQSPRTTLLDALGLQGSVLQSTENPGAALRALAWISSEAWSPRMLAVSSRTTLFRNTHLTNAKPWVNPLIDPAAATNYGETVQASLSRESYLFVPRIPAADEYLAALDIAVLQAIGGEKTPTAALADAAAAWVQITQKIGLQNQKRAYLRELGLDP